MKCIIMLEEENTVPGQMPKLMVWFIVMHFRIIILIKMFQAKGRKLEYVSELKIATMNTFATEFFPFETTISVLWIT